MEFRVLGSVRATYEGRDLPLGRRRERLLLGLLLLEQGRTIPTARLVELIMPDRDPAPAGAGPLVRVAVSRLRASLTGLPDVRVVARHGGYGIEVDPDTVDANRFRAEVAAAAGTTDPGERAALLARALGRWDGPVLADVAPPELRQLVGGGLEELRLGAVEAWLGARIEDGHAEAVLTEVIDRIAEQPAREPLVALLMRAYLRLGRYADASRAYHDLQARISDDHGPDPGPELRALFGQVLRADAAPVRPPEPGRPVPAELPSDLATFTGRAAELAELDGWRPDPRSAAPPLGLVVGPPGVGKTALAVRWARTHASRFPDGQIWLNLRGDDHGRALEPGSALVRLLDALGVDPRRVPRDVDEAAALYRSELAARRVLVVLDNARSADQIRPLLPGAAGCMVLVTSRYRLTDLVARDGARRLHLAELNSVTARGGAR